MQRLSPRARLIGFAVAALVCLLGIEYDRTKILARSGLESILFWFLGLLALLIVLAFLRLSVRLTRQNAVFLGYISVGTILITRSAVNSTDWIGASASGLVYLCLGCFCISEILNASNELGDLRRIQRS